MNTGQALTNQYGNQWQVEYEESERLTTIGGYLITYGSIGCVTVSAMLTPEVKAQGHAALLRYLQALKVGTPGVHLWRPDNE